MNISHAWRSMEMRVGETVAPDGKCTPTSLQLNLFQDEFGGTRDANGVGWGDVSLSGSPSSSEMGPFPDSTRRGSGAGETGGETFGVVPAGFDPSLFLMRVGAADELRLMGCSPLVRGRPRCSWRCRGAEGWLGEVGCSQPRGVEEWWSPWRGGGGPILVFLAGPGEVRLVPPLMTSSR